MNYELKIENEGMEPSLTIILRNKKIMLPLLKFIQNMNTITKTYYTGTAFIPGALITIPEINKTLQAFMQITDNLRKINNENPLPVEFDEILSQPVKFNSNH